MARQPLDMRILTYPAGLVHSAQRGNLKFREDHTLDSEYIGQLLKNGYDNECVPMPEEAPVVRMRERMDTVAHEPRRASTGTQTENNPVNALDAPMIGDPGAMDAPSTRKGGTCRRSSSRLMTNESTEVVPNAGRPRRNVLYT
ncbi:TPA: hypothetical protein N0F65_011269 [Lagenidium giganteum]|uniref:Uncharacterized protein n=1 Tax=Lagenidium giganteum TaxID=4803 RepID=A0AAV2Z2Q8_9STRA|nr:TPA: hypothetical protein N0F65_011269 [Lagenidium giganteum]